jgi:hypothetical protein
VPKLQFFGLKIIHLATLLQEQPSTDGDTFNRTDVEPEVPASQDADPNVAKKRMSYDDLRDQHRKLQRAPQPPPPPPPGSSLGGLRLVLSTFRLQSFCLLI